MDSVAAGGVRMGELMQQLLPPDAPALTDEGGDLQGLD